MSDLVVTDADLGGPSLVRIRVSQGRITDIGTDLAIGPADRTFEAAGGGVLPGLHDHHVHLYAAAAAARSLRLGPPDVSEREHLVRALSEGDRLAAPGAWLRGIQYHESVAGPLDRTSLDAIVPDRPVRIQHRSGSQWILNSRGLELLLPAAFNDEGMERDSSGSPTGRLTRMDRWIDDSLGHASPPFEEISRSAARRGVTGFTDATPFGKSGELADLARAKARGHLRQRVSVMTAPGSDVGCQTHLSVGPVKVLLDDVTLPSFEELRLTVAETHRAGRAVAVHCVTRVQIVLTATVLEDVGSIPGDRIEHGGVIPLELVPVLSRLKVTVVTNPGFIRDRGDHYLSDIEALEVPNLYRCASLRNAGVLVACGTDAPFGPDDPWTVAQTAATRRTRSGKSVGPEERVDNWTAISMFLGSSVFPATMRTVSPGAAGDLCLLYPPLREGLRELSVGNVAACVVAGELIADNR
jgi:predicted amidohydrolase YtcJ